jgi:hypothetical protein
MPPEHVSQRIREHCLNELVPCGCGRAQKRYLVSLGFAVFVTAGLLVIGFLRHPAPRNLAPLLGIAGLFSVVVAAVLHLTHACVPGRRSGRGFRTGMLTLGAVGFLVHLFLTTDHGLGFAQFLTEPRSVRVTVSCGVHALLFGLLSTLGLFFVWRRTDPYSPRLTGALTGLAGGLIGGVAMDVVCTSREFWHLGLSHALPLLLSIALGAMLGKRWLSP